MIGFLVLHQLDPGHRGTGIMKRIVTTVVLVFALGTVGCGDDQSDTAPAAEQARSFALTLGGSGKNVRLSASKSTPEGLTRIELTSTAKGRHTAQLVRFDAGRTSKQAIVAINDWFEGKPLPAWVHLEGGVEANADQPATTIQILPAGQYVAFDTNAETDTPPRPPSKSQPAKAAASCQRRRRASR